MNTRATVRVEIGLCVGAFGLPEVLTITPMPQNIPRHDVGKYLSLCILRFGT